MSYFEFENIKMSDIIDYLAVYVLMVLNIPKEEWLKETE
jgi:hypothetical protein